MSKEAPLILWFRRDLRLADNPALIAALDQKAPVIPLFILDEESRGGRPLGGAARWWLGRSLTALHQSLEKLDAKLILRRGESLDVLRQVIKASGSKTVFFN